MKPQLKLRAKYDPENDVTLATSDFRKFLSTIPDDEAQLVVTSPPYNLGKEYERTLPQAQYRNQLLKTAVEESIRITRPGGSICFQVGNSIVGPSLPRPLAFMIDPIFRRYEQKHNVHLRNVIIWHFGHGLHSSRRFSGRYETILWYTKGDNYKFNLNAVRVPQKYPGKTYSRGTKKGQPSGNRAGKNPGDVWLDIPNVKSNHIEKTEHPCQFPVGLAHRLILALSDPKDLIVDPFVGVGSTAVAAVLLNRRAAGSDIVAGYLATARTRVRRAWGGKLKFRENGPVYQPSGREAVAQIPDSWNVLEGDPPDL